MDYELSESSGTDDDLPPSHQHSIVKGDRIVGNGRSALSSTTYSRMLIDMESYIRQLEQEAYMAVLRAFKAQSDAISWDKEYLITELRRELRVSDDQHREHLTRVNGDEVIRRIREWRQSGGHQTARSIASQPVHDVVVSPSVSGSRKRQKTFPPVQPMPGLSSTNYMPLPPTGPAGSHPYVSRIYSAPLATNAPADATTSYSLIGRKVWTRWPEDNSFYEAEIAEYNPNEGRHALVYDKNTPNETWEWVDLKEISPEDIQWADEDPGISYYSVHGGQGRGIKKSMSHGGHPSVGRGRGSAMMSQNKRGFLPAQNGFAKIVSDDIELLNTDTLVQEVEKVFSLSHPDPLELEKAKKMLKEHEHALVEAIARLADASDGESGEPQFLQRQVMDLA